MVSKISTQKNAYDLLRNGSKKYFVKKRFKYNESEIHKRAKERLREWLSNSNFMYPVCFTPNRSSGVWSEYPIVVDNKYNSVINNWDEILTNPNIPKDMDTETEEFENLQYEFVPTFEQCKKAGSIPKAVVDLVCTHKGSPKWFIEICYKNPTSQKKVNLLRSLGVKKLIQVSAKWILAQKVQPSRLHCLRLIDEDF